MSMIRINNHEYSLHPVYDLYGADINGNIINIITKESVDIDQEMMNFKVKKLHGKPKKYKITSFIWESYNGIKPKGMSIIHINNDEQDNRISNLQLKKIVKEKHLTDDERLLQNKACAKRWREREWKCNKCGVVTNNNSSRHHRRVCPFSDKPLTEKEKQKKIKNNNTWSNKQHECQKCGVIIKNKSKWQHNKICNRQEE